MPALHFPRLLALVIGMTLLTASHAEDIAVGVTAPDFQLLDQNNETQRLRDYRGQWVVMYFYPKNDTPGCTTEACNFRDDIFELKALDAAVLGVSIDDTESHAAFAEKYSLPFPLLADREATVANKYGAVRNLGLFKLAKRYTFIIDPSGKIAKVYRDVKPKQHSDRVIADLKRLQNDPSVAASPG